jgi:hypothetical protein
MPAVIELVESEAVVWERMPDSEREICLVLLGAILRWWDRTHPIEVATNTAEVIPIRKSDPPASVPTIPAGPPDREPSEEELLRGVRSGVYGVRAFRALESGSIHAGNVREVVARIRNPGVSEEVPPTHEPSPIAG